MHIKGTGYTYQFPCCFVYVGFNSCLFQHMVTATYKQYDIASHDVMHRLIYVKWKYFGQYVKQLFVLLE